MHRSPAGLGPPIFLPLGCTGGLPVAIGRLFGSAYRSVPALQNAPAPFIMTVADDSAIDVGIFDGSLITADRSLVPKDGDAVVVDVNDERSIKFSSSGRQMYLAFGNRR